ncbi:transmembrane reductase CYB561D2-like [Cylas formicarius]|uniref:transmembrane reductase CYB561D2-like n=1 Tax=Cylas formicarius TaxID=197179 RepID=UPI002958CC73|nr:transmembrane reductase CYB561D2-like [Cylas formicarius]
MSLSRSTDYVETEVVVKSECGGNADAVRQRDETSIDVADVDDMPEEHKNAKNEDVAVGGVPKRRASKEFKKPKDVVTFKTHLTTLAIACVVTFVYVVLKLSFRGDFVFFTWHPVLMSIGYMLLMTAGFFAINKNNTYWRFKTTGTTRVRVHFIAIGAGYTLSLVAFLVVYVNKNNLNKSHFVSWHGLCGVIALASTLPPIINGIVLLYKKELKDIIKNAKLVKFIHVSSGCLSFLFGSITLLLSPYTKWFGKKSEGSDFLFYLALIAASYSLLWALYGPVVKLVNVVKEKLS